jgi:hypothetical protein
MKAPSRTLEMLAESMADDAVTTNLIRDSQTLVQNILDSLTLPLRQCSWVSVMDEVSSAEGYVEMTALK